MADIDVVKKGSRSWVWILLIAALALVVWFVMAGNRTRTVGQLEMGGQPHLAAVFTGSPISPSAPVL